MPISFPRPIISKDTMPVPQLGKYSEIKFHCFCL